MAQLAAAVAVKEAAPFYSKMRLPTGNALEEFKWGSSDAMLFSNPHAHGWPSDT